LVEVSSIFWQDSVFVIAIPSSISATLYYSFSFVIVTIDHYFIVTFPHFLYFFLGS